MGKYIARYAHFFINFIQDYSRLARLTYREMVKIVSHVHPACVRFRSLPNKPMIQRRSPRPTLSCLYLSGYIHESEDGVIDFIEWLLKEPAIWGDAAKYG